MDGKRFDLFTRALTVRMTRRGSGVAVVGAFFAGRVAIDDTAAVAVGRKTCRRNGASCLRNADCCSKKCETCRRAPRSRRNRCQCVPDCFGRTTGPDGCGGTCDQAGRLRSVETSSCTCGCACIPSCEGKTCGNDGCEGYCGPNGSYGCLSGEGCGDDYNSCADPCKSNPAPPAPFTCVAGTMYDTYLANEVWDLAVDAPCETASDCPNFGLCSAPGYACVCMRGWRDSSGAQSLQTVEGACRALRTGASLCDSGPFTGEPGDSCAESIEGDQFRHWGWKTDWSGHAASCTSDQACIAKDGLCTSEPTLNRCLCEIGGSATSGGAFVHDGGTCRMVRLQP